MTTSLPELLLVFEWLLHHSPVPVDEACTRFGMDRATFQGLVNTLAFVGEAPSGPNELLSAYIDDETDLVHVDPFPGLPEGVSLDLDLARTLYAITDSLTRLPAFESAEQTRGAAERLGQALTAAGVDVDAIRNDLNVPGAEFVAPIQRAILDRRRARIAYRSASSNRTAERLVDPIALFQQRAVWYLDAFDHLRGSRIPFRLDRIEDLHETDERYEISYAPSTEFGFDPNDRAVAVVLEVAPEAAWLAERLREPVVERRSDGGARISLRVSGVRWLVPLLLAAGPGAVIVEPAELRALVHAAARAARARYAPGTGAGSS